MKPTHKLLFVLCSIMVVVFIYYSSLKLHFTFWRHKTHVHKKPSVTLTVTNPKAVIITNAKVTTELDLDAASKGRPGDSEELEQQSTLDRKFSTTSAQQDNKLGGGACMRGHAATKIAAIFPKFTKPMPMFLDRNFRQYKEIRNYLPPFGVRSQEKIVDAILTATKKYDLSPELQSLSCTKCVIVGNGGILANKSLGLRIDAYDIVVRLNKAPVKGYTRDVGTKTTMRITYPEGAFNKTEQYEKNSLFVFSAFKPQDFKWLRQMIYGEKLRSTEGYWKSVPNSLPKKPSELRILNPYFFQESAFKLIGLPLNNGLMGKGNIPTLGTVAITMALHNCDEVDVAGFGYDLSTPQAPLHYYESVKMSAIKESWTHNISKEKEFLRKLVKADVITDLTKGI